MRNAGIAILVVLVAGMGFLVFRGSKGRELDPVRPGVLAQAEIGRLHAGMEVCQRPLDVDRELPIVGIALDSLGKPGPQLDVAVRKLPGGEELATGEVPKGWELAIPNYYGVDLSEPIPADTAVEVCAKNVGKRSVGLVGKESILASAAYLDGVNSLAGDWAVFFPDPENLKSHLALLPDMVARASVLRPGIVTPALYVLLAVLLVVAGPVLLWRAVAAAAAADEGSAPPEEREDPAPVEPL